MIDDNKADLAHIMTCEQGKPIKETLGKIDCANSFIRFFTEDGKRIYGDTISPCQTRVALCGSKRADWVCTAITPWNFPVAMITRKVAPTLAAGCVMIVKPATQTPFSSLVLAKHRIARRSVSSGDRQI